MKLSPVVKQSYKYRLMNSDLKTNTCFLSETDKTSWLLKEAKVGGIPLRMKKTKKKKKKKNETGA